MGKIPSAERTDIYLSGANPSNEEILLPPLSVGDPISGCVDGCLIVDECSAVDGHIAMDGCTAMDGCITMNGCSTVDGRTAMDGCTTVDGCITMYGCSAVDGHTAMDGCTVVDGRTTMEGCIVMVINNTLFKKNRVNEVEIRRRYISCILRSQSIALH